MLAIYCRISKTKKTDYSIEVQREAGEEFAKKMKMDFEVYIDEGVSGTLPIKDRPNFYKMYDKIRKGKITAVYCIDQSRIERNTDVWRLFSAECINSGCKFYPNGNELKIEDKSIKLFADILSLFNSYYAEMVSEKVKAANELKAKKGKTHGLKPYGFGKDENNKFILIEDEAKVVREMYDLSLSGIGTYRIADMLNAKGYPTRLNGFSGKVKRKNKDTGRIEYFEKENVQWRGNVVHGILTNPINKGERYWNGKKVATLDVKIVDGKKWKKVNNNLAKNKKDKSGRKEKYKYLLNGLITCDHCGGKYVGKRNPQLKDNTYKCKARREKQTCKEGRGINIIKLDNFILSHLFNNDKLKELILTIPKNESELEGLKKRLAKKERELLGHQKYLNNCRKRLLDDRLKDDEFIINEYEKAKISIENVNDEIEGLKVQIYNVENETQRSIAKSALEAYAKGIPFEELKKLVQLLIKDIRIESFESWSEPHKEMRKFFKITVSFNSNNLQTSFYTDRFAKHWTWAVETDEESELDAKKLEFNDQGVGHQDLVENVNGHLIYLGTFADISLVDKEKLIDFNASEIIVNSKSK